MKVLFLVSDANSNGGTEILAYNLLHELNRKGLECKLLSRWVYTGNDPDVISLPADKATKYCKIINSPIDKLCGHKLSDEFIKKEIKRIAVEGNFDWIVNHTYDLCAAIPNIKGIKTAQIFNWSIPGYEKVLSGNIASKGFIRSFVPLLAFKLLRNRWHRSLTKFSRLVMLTDSAHKEIHHINPTIASESIVTIPDPLMQTTFSEKTSSLRNKNVVFVGRLSHEKGVMRLLRIWKRISTQLPDYTLSIYGTGDCLGEMVDFLRGNGLTIKVYGEQADCESLEKNINPKPSPLNPPQVQFMGFCNNLEEIYTDADLLLMTSDSEGFGMVLIEAMYYGVPCITFDCPVSPKEIIADAGIAIPCFDEEMYANEVVKLLQDSKRMEDMQKKAIKRADKYYINKVADLWKDLLYSYL